MRVQRFVARRARPLICSAACASKGRLATQPRITTKHLFLYAVAQSSEKKPKQSRREKVFRLLGIIRVMKENQGVNQGDISVKRFGVTLFRVFKKGKVHGEVSYLQDFNREVTR